MNNTVKLIIAIAVPLLVGFSAGQFTAAEIPTWYASIKKPSWNPPSWVFAPVWTTLYVMMGIAWFLIWKAPATEMKKWGMILFVLQLVLNFFWTFIFFAKHQPGAAFIEIVVLWLAILCTIIAFSKINKTAAWLLVPYISWVSFAAILNYTIWQLNL